MQCRGPITAMGLAYVYKLCFSIRQVNGSKLEWLYVFISLTLANRMLTADIYLIVKWLFYGPGSLSCPFRPYNGVPTLDIIVDLYFGITYTLGVKLSEIKV